MLTGRYSITSDTPIGMMRYELELTEHGEALSGRLIDPQSKENWELTEGKANGDKFSARVKMKVPDFGMCSVSLTGTASEDRLRGSVSMYMGSAYYTGKKLGV